ncbi:hypothetical protein [Paractinoplanes rishiriensis]|uniref:Peptidase inhibitor family I36 n=1 Tax=Paractinoplanes rishiriensis TaxID=1050105 RepID=A0A919K4J7_9ACTN|nr:hypothetical protein [Actinoplanes rishiriensis]GIE98712.1 hypothetical protein Ari01nite_61770 [Actinoplanes rishiriensis]
MHKRWSAVAAATFFASAAVVLGIAGPASANTNFNGSCESSEGCIYKNTRHVASQGIWDYEGTDRDLRGNYFINASGTEVDDNGTSFQNNGTSCIAMWGNHTGTNSTWAIWAAPGGGKYDAAGTSYNDQVTSMWWEC